MKPYATGVERTRVEDMMIGDYIKWKHTGYKVNNPGILAPYNPVTDATMEEQPISSEVQPTGNRVKTDGGYFYYVKVDRGLLIPDRVVWYNAGGCRGYAFLALINKYNYYKGSVYRLLTSEEYTKYTINPYLLAFTKPIHNNTIQLWHGNRYSEYLVCQDVIKEQGGQSEWYPFNETDYDFLLYPAYQYVDNAKSTNIFY